MRISNNLGDAKSLITHPATTTHQRLKPEQRAELGISDGLVRVSVGLEHPDDIMEDVLAALEKVVTFRANWLRTDAPRLRQSAGSRRRRSPHR